MNNQTHFLFPIRNEQRLLARLNSLEISCNEVISNPSGGVPGWMRGLDLECLSNTFYDVKIVHTNKGPCVSVAIPSIVDVSCLGAVLHSLFELERSDAPEWLLPITMQSGVVKLLISRQGHGIVARDTDLSHATTGIPPEDIEVCHMCEKRTTDFPFSKLPPVIGIRGLPNTYKSALALHLARAYEKKTKLVYICNEVYPAFSGANVPAEVLYDCKMSCESLVRYMSILAAKHEPMTVIIDDLNALYLPLESAALNASRSEKLLCHIRNIAKKNPIAFILITHERSNASAASVSKYVDWDILTTSATKDDVTFTLKTSTGTEFAPITLPMTSFG